ncbi:hypothetical protein [Streptomyces turgidiscabies]|uniref:Transposase n=1 Tax=Streptomyces turgidiscabies TaxID=85558 RepID=A0ABU0RRH4_9ACTN|nr:hypothetical protein [Streptomyces turgidiscabies]MDQ0933752.1 hypothetical protein [Streptomyces turgidiscabies]
MSSVTRFSTSVRAVSGRCGRLFGLLGPVVVGEAVGMFLRAPAKRKDQYPQGRLTGQSVVLPRLPPAPVLESRQPYVVLQPTRELLPAADLLAGRGDGRLLVRIRQASRRPSARQRFSRRSRTVSRTGVGSGRRTHPWAAAIGRRTPCLDTGSPGSRSACFRPEARPWEQLSQLPCVPWSADSHGE